MNKIIKIYCEGKRGSHDYDILEKIIDGLPSIQIEPIGGIRGAGAIIQYREQREIVKSHFYLLFRDRDFDKAIPVIPCLEQDPERKYCYFAYRITIENYLFTHSIFFSFLQETNLLSECAIQTEDDAKEKLIAAAKQIKFYQAVRHTMGAMRTGDTNFGTKWTEKSCILPKSLTEKDCKEEALKKINAAKELTTRWDEVGFNTIYQSFIEKFDDTFMNNFEFLVYFQGKDFAAALVQLLPKSFSIDKFYRYAKKHFDYTNFEDLKQLRTLIESQL